MNKRITYLLFLVIIAVSGIILYFSQNKTSVQLVSVPSYKKTSNGAIYMPYSREAYDKALKENKIIFLDFYANWCPICLGEAPEIEQGFLELNNKNIVGFRVNYKDNETNEDEKKLAKEFSVPYQHTKVVLKNGKEVLRDGNTWNKELVIKTLNSL